MLYFGSSVDILCTVDMGRHHVHKHHSYVRVCAIWFYAHVLLCVCVYMSTKQLNYVRWVAARLWLFVPVKIGNDIAICWRIRWFANKLLFMAQIFMYIRNNFNAIIFNRIKSVYYSLQCVSLH